MIKLQESMGPGRDRTRDPWICSQTRICCQTRYRLRYAARWTDKYDRGKAWEVTDKYDGGKAWEVTNKYDRGKASEVTD